MRKILSRFMRSQDGNIIIFTGLAIFVLVLSVGVAIDMSRAQILKSRVQAAADAANLAAGVAYIQNHCATASDPQSCFNQYSVPKAKAYFAADFPTGYLGSSPLTITPHLKGNEIDLTINSTTPITFPLLISNTNYASFTSTSTNASDVSALAKLAPAAGDNPAEHNISVKISSQVTLPNSTPTNGKCGSAFAGSCLTGISGGDVFYTSTSGNIFGTWSCSSTSTPLGSSAQCCTPGTRTTPCTSGATGSITQTSICINGALVWNTTSNTCPTPPITCANGSYPVNGSCQTCTPDIVPFWVRPNPLRNHNNYCNAWTGDTCTQLGALDSSGQLGFALNTTGGLGLSTSFSLLQAGSEYSDNGAQIASVTGTDSIGGQIFPFSNCEVEFEIFTHDITNKANEAALYSCYTSATSQAIILADYLSLVQSTPPQINDPEALYCPITFTGTLLSSPLKVNIAGGNALLNSDHTVVYEMTNHYTGQKELHTVEGGLNTGEAWLMVDRDGTGILHNGIINGDDFFTDHNGEHPNAYHDLARWFHEFIKKDEKGRSYIPLDVADEKVKTKNGHNPYLDLKVLDANNTIVAAHQFFDRIYVDHINTSEANAGLKSIILQRALVRDLNQRFHLSADQWFGLSGNNFTFSATKASSGSTLPSSK